MNQPDHALTRSRRFRMATCRSMRLNVTEVECFCSLPLDDRIHLHIPAFMALAMECRQSEGLNFPDTTGLLEDIVFYSAMFGLFLETGRTEHPVELVKARYRIAESDPTIYPALLAVSYSEHENAGGHR